MNESSSRSSATFAPMRKLALMYCLPCALIASCARCGLMASMVSSQGLSFDLAVVGLRQAVHELDVFRHHEALEPRTAVTDDLPFAVAPAGTEHDEGLDGLSEECVRNADHRHLEHPGQPVERVLDLARAHLFAARLDDVVLASDEVQIPFGVAAEDVARIEHALAGQRPGLEALRRLDGLLPVAAHHVTAADHELPSSAVRQATVRLVDQPQLLVRHAAADGGRPGVELLGARGGHAAA